MLIQRRIKDVIYVAMFFLSLQKTYAQEKVDSNINLQSVSIQGTKLQVGLNTVEIDTSILKLHKSSSLSELLSQNSSVFIKTYGQGGLATSSFRGTGSSHTQVLWNDFNINSPMLGELDFSTIPVFMIDEMQIYYGGSSVVANSGSLGGSILLNNKANWSRKLDISSYNQYGSFNMISNSLKAEVGNKKYRSLTRLYRARSDNNFNYINNTKEGNPKEVRLDADYETLGVMQELHYKTNSNNIFSSRIWVQENERSIPPPLVVNHYPGNENRKDEFVRSMAEWKHFAKKSKLIVKAAHLYESMYYTNIISEIDSENRINSFQGKVKYDNNIRKSFSAFMGANVSAFNVETNNYEGVKSREQFSLFSGVDFNINKRLFALLVFRGELADNEVLPIIPSLGLEYRISELFNWRLTTNIARNYHLPTLNELYWQPVGNPDLKPEKGISYEVGTKCNLSFNRNFSIKPKVNLFYSFINDWILWYPNGSSNYWSPLNLKEVESRGVDAFLDIGFKLNNLKLNYYAVLTYTKSVNKKETSIADQAVGKQLIYVPELNFNNTFKANFNKFSVFYTAQYISKRYTVLDNTRFMPSYFLADTGMGKCFAKNGFSFELGVRVNNVFDVDYQAIAWQPMPKRHYNISLLINLKK